MRHYWIEQNAYWQVNRLVRWALRDLKRQGRIQRTHKGRYYSLPSPELQAAVGCCPPVPGLPQRLVGPGWSSQRRHLVSAIHRWDQYNQRRAQRLARAPAPDAPAGLPPARPRPVSALYDSVSRLFPAG